MSSDWPQEADEVDYHLRIHGKRADTFRYSEETCQFCNSRIDDRNWCACDTMGGD